MVDRVAVGVGVVVVVVVVWLECVLFVVSSGIQITFDGRASLFQSIERPTPSHR